MSAFRLVATGSRQDIYAPMVRQALLVLADPDHGVELRGLPSRRSVTAPAVDIDSLVEHALTFADDRGVYYCLNPIPATLGKAAKNSDVISRRWILVDIDPVKPGEHKDSSATDAEHERAGELAARVMEYLGGHGWPAPVLVDSGNGWHLLYRVDLPNDEQSRAMVRQVLKVLAQRCNNEHATIDIAVHNASRIAKLPGTWARKGPDTKERPHRQCRLERVPNPVDVVPIECVRAVCQQPTPPAQPPPTNGSSFMMRAGGESESAYGRRALELECNKIHVAAAGTRNNALNTAAFSLGQLVGGKVLHREDVENALSEAGTRAGLTNHETIRTIQSGLDAGAEKPRGVPERNGAHTPPPIDPGVSIIIRASEVTPRKVEWLWPGRIPLGKMTTFAGVGGLGKTFVLCDLAARVSRGVDWPDGEKCEPGLCLFISGEDDIEDTLVPRLIEAGCDLTKVVFLKNEIKDQFVLKDLNVLQLAIDQAGKPVRFVVVDPPTAYLGDVDDHKNAELRSLLSPLHSWAASNRLAMVFNTHVNKPQGTKVDAMMRVMGSVAWVNAVRAAHMFARDPEDPARRLMVGMKLNIGKERKGLAYKIADTADLARIEWLGEVDMTADEAINRSGNSNRRSVLATEWIAELFAATDQLSSKDIDTRRKAETKLSLNAVKEAREEMGIRSRQESCPDGGNHWVCYWRADDRQRWDARRAPAEEQNGVSP